MLRLLRLQNHGPVFFLDYAGFFNLLLLFVRLRIVPPLMMKMLPRRGGGGQKRRHQRKPTSTITLRRRQNTRCSHHHHRRCRTTRRRHHHHHLFSLSLSLTRETLRKRARTFYTYKIPTSGENEKILGKKTLLLLLQKRPNTRVRCTSRKRAEESVHNRSRAGKRKLRKNNESRKKIKTNCFFLRGESSFLLSQTRAKVEKKEQTFFHLRKKSTRKSRVEKSSRKHTTDFNRRESCFFQKMSSFRKRAVFSLEKEHTTEQSKSLLVHTQTDFAF